MIVPEDVVMERTKSPTVSTSRVKGEDVQAVGQEDKDSEGEARE